MLRRQSNIGSLTHLTAKLALIAYHAVDESVNCRPFPCLNQGVQTREYITDIFLVLRTNSGGQRVGRSIPSGLSSSPRLLAACHMWEHAERLAAVQFFHEHASLPVAERHTLFRPVIVEEDESRKDLFGRIVTILVVMAEQHGKPTGIDGEWVDAAITVVDQQPTEVLRLFLRQDTRTGKY